MPKNHDLHVKLTKSQKEKITANAQAEGFSSISHYIRQIALERGWTMEQRIREIHSAIVGQKNDSRQKGRCKLTKYNLNKELEDYALKKEYDQF
jgi:Arc/MetJ-type ribon-helix-helix transcriptional regulator